MQSSFTANGAPSLKRSASVASLPTPPRTTRKRRGGRPRPADSSDDEGGHVQKKRRRLNLSDDEDDFWLPTRPGTSSKSQLSSQSDPGEALGRDTDEETGILFRPRQILASPPPSHRKTRTKMPRVALFAPSLPSLPEIPKTPTKPRAKELLMRDSPDNPFLDSPILDDDEEAEEDEASPTPSGSKFVQKSHIAYVHRGRRVFVPNPDYDATKEDHTRSPPPESKLPMDHPEYEPDLRCPPKALFTSTRSRLRRRKASSPKPKQSIPDPFESDDDDKPRKSRKRDVVLLSPGASGGRPRFIPVEEYDHSIT